MHVLVAAHDCYPDPGSGGTGRYVYETGRRLAARDARVSVITRRRGDVPRREHVDGIDVYRYDLSIAGRPGAAIARQLPTASRTVGAHVAEIVADGPPDVLSFQGPTTSLLVDRYVDRQVDRHAIRRVDDVPRVLTFHSPWPTEYRLRTRGDDGATGLRRRLNAAARHRLERTLVERADRAVTLSEFMRRELATTYGATSTTSATSATSMTSTTSTTAVDVIPGGVDAERFHPDAGPSDLLDSDHDGTAFLTVRRLSERMGHGRLLEAFADVVEDAPDARLYVAGAGPLRDRLERRAAALGVADRTTFLGYVPDADLPAAYAAADVFVLPTVELEGFGLATLEALAAGTPVVGTPVGGTVEVLGDLQDRAAIPERMLVPAASADAIRGGMCAWASLDDDALAAAGRECRRYARERYSWERTTDALAALYGEFAADGPGDQADDPRTVAASPEPSKAP